MTEFTKALLIASLYRYLLIVAGALFVYLGYRLFLLGYFEKAGEIRVAFGANHLLAKQVAPGVMFALLGVATIAVGIARKVTISVPAVIVSGQNSAVTSEWVEFSDKTVKPCDDTAFGQERFEGNGGRSRKSTNSILRDSK